MSIENPSLLYVEQSLTSTQKARALANIGAQAAEVGKGLSTNDFDNAALGTLQSVNQKVQGIESGAEVNVIDEITVNGTAVTPTGKTVALTIPAAVTVDQTYNGSSTNPQSGIAVAQALSGTGQVPTVTSNDDGKVLKASYDSQTSQGSFRWDSAPSGVPSTTSADEGKVLGVTNSSGSLGWVSQTPVAHDSTVTVKTGDSTPVTLGSFTTDQSSNSDITIPLAAPTGTGEKSGLMSAADKAKLDGLKNAIVAGSSGITVTPDTSVAGVTTYTVSADSTDLYVDDTLKKTNDTPNTGDITLGVKTKTSNSYLDTTSGLGVDLSALKTGIGTGNNGLVPSAGSSGQFLKHDGSWGTPPDTTYSGGNGIDITGTVVSVDIASSGSGLEFSSNKLKVNGNASQAIEVGASGVGIKLATGSGLEFSSGLKVKTDGTTIQTNASGALEVIGGGGTTYTAGDGIDIASSTIKANIDTAAGLKFDSSSPKKIQINTGTNIGFNSTTGALDVPTVSASTGGTGGTDGVMLATDKEKLDNATVAVKLEGALAPLTPSSGVATIPNAIPTGTTGASNGLITADDQAKLDSAVIYHDNGQSGESALLAEQLLVFSSDTPLYGYNFGGKGSICFITMGV